MIVLSPDQKLEAARSLDACADDEQSASMRAWRQVTAEAWAKTAIACLTRIREDAEHSEAERVSALAYVRDIAEYHLAKVMQQGGKR